MNQESINLEQFDQWLREGSNIAALVMRQWLEPVEGKETVIFPPTYPIEKDQAGYNIDRFADGSSVCQVDSVGSQANRMEPIFRQGKYVHLVPQVVVEADEQKVHLLDAGHRAADAIVRFSAFAPKLENAFKAAKTGNLEPIAKIAPTSLVFGVWDSRETQVKLPRIVRSVIRAFNVQELRRSAQYATIAGEILGDAEVTTKGKKAELGLAHVPSVHKHGGVLVKGEIRRDAALNLEALRALGVAEGDDPLPLRRYILGLSLVAFTAPQNTSLREGCQLVPDLERRAQWQLVKHDGQRQENFMVSHEDALAYAILAAEAFGVGESKTVAFDRKKVEAALKEKDKPSKGAKQKAGETEEADAGE